MSSYVFLPINIFLVLQISCFGKAKTCCDLNTVHRIHNFVSLIFQWYHCAIGVLSVWHMFRNYVIYRCDWLSIKFCGTILLENCSFFSKIPFSISVESPRIFQCFTSIPAGHSVRQIDGDLSRRSFFSQICFSTYWWWYWIIFLNCCGITVHFCNKFLR